MALIPRLAHQKTSNSIIRIYLLLQVDMERALQHSMLKCDKWLGRWCNGSSIDTLFLFLPFFGGSNVIAETPSCWAVHF